MIKRFLSSKQSFWNHKTSFWKNFFPMVPPLVLRSPLKFFLDQFWKFFNYASNSFQNMKKRFLSSKQSFSNDKNMFWKNFFPMVPPLVLRSPLKFFFDQFWKFFNYASNCFKIWKNVFFHQNNHFQIIKTCFEKKFFPMVPPLVLRSPLKFFFGTSFENFSTMLQIVLKIWKNVFFHQNNHFQIIKTCFEKIFFPMVPPLVLRSPLKFFFDQFWKFFNMLQIVSKYEKTFSFIKTIIFKS